MPDSDSDESQSQGRLTQPVIVPIFGSSGMVMTSLPVREAPSHSQHSFVPQQDATTSRGSGDAQLSGLVQAAPASNVDAVAAQTVVFQGRGPNVGVYSRGNRAVGAPFDTTATTQGEVRQGNPNIGPPPATTASPSPPPPPPPTALSRRRRRPVTTLVNVLPKTPYDETKEPAGTKHTLEYIWVQRQILECLGEKAADTLSGVQACHWTNMISLEENPKAMEALRLCYYMRSQGFDTYARFKDAYMELYVANPGRNYARESSTKIHHETDTLYWKQDTLTDEVIIRVTPWPSPVSRFRRRNALVPPPQPVYATIQGLHTRSSNAPHSQGGSHMANGQEQGAQSNADADAVHRPNSDDLATLIAATQAAIERLILNASSDGARIRALETQLEEYMVLASNHQQR